MASSALATAFVNIVPGTVAVENYLKTQLGGQVASAGDLAGGQLAGGVAGGFGSKIKAYIGPLVAGMAASFALVNVKNFLGDAITNASSLNEAGTATIQIFGDASTEIAKFADGAVNIGLSSIAATDAAKTFGIFGKSAGLAGQANVDFSTKLTTLAADLASFNNTTPEEAILALGAGLRGEAEPLRRFGVLLDDFTLRQKAVELGLTRTTKEALTPQMKVMASYGVIMDQTSVQQGDFARTSDGLANQQRILDAQMENLKTNIGQGLLPVMTDLAHFANDVLVPAFTNFTNFFKDYGPVIGAFAGTLLILTLALNAQAIATAISTSSVWLFTAALLANPMTWIVIAIAAFVAAIVLLATKTQVFQTIWAAMSKFVVDTWNNVVKWFGEAWTNITKFFQDALNFIVRIFMDWTIYGLIIKFVAWIGQNWQKIGQVFVQVWNNIVSFFSTVWNNIVSFVSTGITNIVKFFTEMPGKIVKAISGFANVLFDFGKNIVQGLLNGATSLLKNVGKFFLNMLPGWIVAPFKAALGIKSPSKVFREFGKNILEGLVEGLLSDEDGVKASMKRVADWVDDALWNKEISAKGAKAATALVAVYSEKLQGLAREHDLLLTRLETAQDELATRLQDKADFLKSISEKFGAGYTIDEKTTAADAIKQLKERVAKAKELAVVSAKLQQMGLNKDLYKQIVETGAVDFAKSIIAGGTEAVTELNVLAGEANTQAAALATQVGTVLFDQGIAFAQSVVDGLISQEAAMRSLMASVAAEFGTSLTAAVKAGVAEADAARVAAEKKTKTTKPGVTTKQDTTKKNVVVPKVKAPILLPGQAAEIAAIAEKKRLAGQTLVNKILGLPKLAAGGFVTRPTAAIIGEAGPELVTPLKDFERMTNMGSNSPTIVYNAAPNQSIDAEQALFQAMKRAKVVAAW